MSDFADDLNALFEAAIGVLAEKRMAYGDSWKKRGGVGAFMVTARKWDRIEHAAKEHGWDIFRAIDLTPGLLEDITDLRNYLTLWEHEILYGRRESDSDPDFTPDSQESPGATPEQLGVGDNGGAERLIPRTNMSFREFDKA